MTGKHVSATRLNDLVNELSSLLDEATILSICSDYDLSKPGEYQAVREILLSISQDVEAEEATGFNPSGLGANDAFDTAQTLSDGVSDANPAADSDLRSSDGLTTTTENSQPVSLASAVSQSLTQCSSDSIHVGRFDGLTVEQTEAELLEIFSSLKLIDIKLALRKTNGNGDLAIDELLNTHWLEQNGQRTKGIDGFFTPEDAASGRKRKGKRKRTAVRTAKSSNSSSANLSEDPENADETAGRNVAYLVERLALPSSEVASIFRQQGSMGATVVEILDNYISALGVTPSVDRRSPAAEGLARKYPWIPPQYLASAFEITMPVHQHGLDLIQILADHFERPAYIKLDVAYNVASSPDVQLETGNPSPSTRTTTVKPPIGWNKPSTLQAAAANTASRAAAMDHSYEAAASAFRRGHSDPLYRQAASFYAERAKDQTKGFRQAVSEEAYCRVEHSSTSNSIDLHGVAVQDGVDIAVDRVHRWWNSLGEDRAGKAREGFTVVTGLGRHSADGRSRLRTNVCKALVADGWKVEVLTGKFLVTGRK